MNTAPMFPIFSNTVIHLDWKDRLKVLFGKEIKVSTTIQVNAQVTVISSGANIEIRPKTKYIATAGIYKKNESAK